MSEETIEQYYQKRFDRAVKLLVRWNKSYFVSHDGSGTQDLVQAETQGFLDAVYLGKEEEDKDGSHSDNLDNLAAMGCY